MWKQPRVVLSDRDRDRLDYAVLDAIKRGGPIKAGEIEICQKVSRVIETLPSGKDAHRYIDGALQRLRRCGEIAHGAKGWRHVP